MRRLAITFLFSHLILGPVISSGASANQQYSVRVDPQAVATAQASIAAMGGAQALANYEDSIATGTLTLYVGSSPGNPQVFPITLKSKGTHETRVEIQMPNGINIRILNHGRAAIQRPDGSTKMLSMANTVGQRVNHIPLLSLLSEYQNASTGLAYQGTALVNGRNANVITLSFVPHTNLADAMTFSAVTKTTLYVDQITNLVAEIQYPNYPEDSITSNPEQVQEYFAQYHIVNGINVPFHQTTYLNRQLETDLVLNSVVFNVGLPDSDFTLPQ